MGNIRENLIEFLIYKGGLVMEKKEIASEMNRLLELLHDSHDGYHESVKEVQDIKMKSLFNELADIRQRMIKELQTILATLGIKPEVTGSMLAAAHRLFLDLKSMVTGGDVDAIVAEIKRGEAFTLERFKEALNTDLPTELKAIVQRYLSEIESNLATIEISSKV